MDNSQSDVNDTICQIDEISNIEKDDLPSSASQSTENIPGDHQLDSTNGAVLSATINVRITIFIPNIILLNYFLTVFKIQKSKDEESQSISTDAEFWNIKNRNRFDYVNSYFDGVEIISIVEVSHNSSSRQTF